MSRRRAFFLTLAIMVGLGTMLMMRSALNHKPAQVAETGTQVLVAVEALPSGQFIQAQQVRWQSWAPEHVTEAFIVKDPKNEQANSDVVGAVVRKGIQAGEPIMHGDVVKPKDRGFLSAVLDPGKRAVAVPITNVTGIAGFVFPGDRVDLILTHSMQARSNDKSGVPQRRVSVTIVRDVRVLALDQDTNDQGDNKPKVGKVITLEVDPKQAEKLTLALQLGTLSLSLRSLADDSAHPQGTDSPMAQSIGYTKDEGYTLDSDVSQIIPAPVSPQEINSQVVQVLRGSAARKQDKFEEPEQK
jgi:pilus assembly protein CpaB